ncbi:MAG: SNF2-related protein, partial [Lentisphaeria bacterium]
LVKSNYPTSLLPKILQKNVINDALPKGKIHIRTAKYKYRGKEQLHADVSFLYNGGSVKDFSQDAKVASFDGHSIYSRNSAIEEIMRKFLNDLGFRFNQSNGREEFGWKLLPSMLDAAVRKLVNQDWIVTANGKSYVKPTDMKIKISPSNADWFDLTLDASCQEQPLPLPEIIKAIKRKQDFVRLDDGSIGILPLEWLKNFTLLTEIGLSKDDTLKFRRSQLLLLNEFIEKLSPNSFNIDSLLSQLKEFEHISPQNPPKSFSGSLRDYQKQALGWMLFLQKFHLGGILADDMGLGKTVQILALLESRRLLAKSPSIIVVPRSLIFNWFQEAKKFTPQMRLHIHSGTNRDRSGSNFHQFDIIITTYGTLVRDVINFNTKFDYCILDESQNIKNAQTQNAKAAIAVNCLHRLCLSGTPIENSLSELLSQLEFLNPGMAACLPALNNINPPNLAALNQSIKPFVLRRTKQQVAKELPPKVEQIIYCEMNPWQKDQYREMREFYRQKLILNQKDKKTEPLQILAALMRLRQIACHPALIDHKFKNHSAAKIDFLLDQINTLISENHKLIVFSQFRSLLQIIAEKLNSINLPFAYIDGSVKNRQAEVEKFQNQPDTKIFLISLKAGGTGLNLTAAEYVFILDPWWNPAAEAQAVDRAYRIGQNNTVFAYRLICRDSVEEKILEIKNRKQALADSLVNNAPLNINDLTADDLEQIFH